MNPPEQAYRLILPGFVFDSAQRELLDATGARVALRAQTLAVLNCLALRPDRLVTKDELMREVWPDVVVTDDSLVQCVKELRRALGDDAHRVVQTESRRDYRLVARRGLEPAPTSHATDATEVAFHQDCWRRPKTEPLTRVMPAQN